MRAWICVFLWLGACAASDDPASDGSETGGATSTGGHGTSVVTSTATTTSSAESTSTTDDIASTSAAASSSESGSGSSGVACIASLEPGEHIDLEIEHDGMTRTFDLFVPSTRQDDGTAPLVVNMHGWGSSKDRQGLVTGMSIDAEARGYAVAYPQGIDDSWNAGFCCGGAVDAEIDDVGFVVALVDQLATQACIDRDRVYATGFSNGGFMAYRLACEAADTFAAVAPVAGVMGTDPEACAPDRSVSVIHFHGTADLNVAYDGRAWLGVPGVLDAMEHWATHDGCDPDPVVTFEMDDVTCQTWGNCRDDAEVTLCSIDGGGHCWPGNAECDYGTSTTTISANERMLDAFDVH